MKKKKMPSSFTILFIIILLVAVLTWVVPSGEYNYVCPDGSVAIPYTKPEATSAVNVCPKDANAAQELNAAQITNDEVSSDLYSENEVEYTYSKTDQKPQGLWQILGAPTSGFYQAVDIALFVIVIGGFINVVMKTNAFDIGINSLLKKYNGREIILIPVLMFLFALGGTTYGMAEETIAFYMLIVPIFYKSGYDALTGFMVIMLGAGVGVIASTVNPFATGVASSAAGVSMGDGIITRTILFLVLLVITIIYVMRYAKKVKSDPTKSDVYDLKKEHDEVFLSNNNNLGTLKTPHKVVLTLFVLAFVIMIAGVVPWSNFGINIFENLNNFINTIPLLSGVGDAVELGGWWFGELTSLFLLFAIIIGFYAEKTGILDGNLTDTFLSGAKDLLPVALIIGLARGVQVIMSSAGMDSTLLYYGSESLQNMGNIGFSIATFMFYIPMSFLIPSTSGLAAASIPVMGPLGDMVFGSSSGSVVVITAFTAACGLVNLITPTSGVVMGGLALAKIPYDRWVKHVLPFLAFLTVIVIIYFIIIVGFGIYI